MIKFILAFKQPVRLWLQTIFGLLLVFPVTAFGWVLYWEYFQNMAGFVASISLASYVAFQVWGVFAVWFFLRIVLDIPVMPAYSDPLTGLYTISPLTGGLPSDDDNH